jgi:outer membrane immunogenic protein
VRAKHRSARRLSSPRAELLKKLLVAGIAAAALVSANASARATPPAPVFNWSGFYVGGNAGYGWDRGSVRDLPNDFAFVGTGTPNPLDFRSHGPFGGVQFGYNCQWMSPWIVGFEGDFAAANLRANSSFSIGTSPISGVLGVAEQKIDSFSTVRARVGYAAGNVLFYGTGGIAWAHETLNTSGISVQFVSFPFASGETRRVEGWAAGGGIEWGLMSNWSAKLEYLRLDFGSRSFTVDPAITASAIHLSSHVDVVRLGLNYRFGNL